VDIVKAKIPQSGRWPEKKRRGGVCARYLSR
jgi:hypothetical protein